MYSIGEGAEVDYTEAIKWYLLAAEQGFREEQFKVGEMYTKGLGVESDKVEASRWFLQAAEDGYIKAQYKLGEIHTYGDGVIIDRSKANKWYWEAAEQGSAEAQYKIGVLFKNAFLEDPEAIEILDYIYKEMENYNKWSSLYKEIEYYRDCSDIIGATEWYIKAARQGHIEAKNELDELYHQENLDIDEDALNMYIKENTELNILCCIDEEVINEFIQEQIKEYFNNKTINMFVCKTEQEALNILNDTHIHYTFLLVSNIRYTHPHFLSFKQPERSFKLIDQIIKKHSKNVVLICNNFYYDDMISRGYDYVLPMPFKIKELKKILDKLEVDI